MTGEAPVGRFVRRRETHAQKAARAQETARTNSAAHGVRPLREHLHLE